MPTVKIKPNNKYLAAISKMSEREMLDEIMKSPEHLTDPFYKKFSEAFYDRYEVLKKWHDAEKK